MKIVIVGTQTGKAEDYEEIYKLADEGTMILDDSNPYELEKFIKETGVITSYSIHYTKLYEQILMHP